MKKECGVAGGGGGRKGKKGGTASAMVIERRSVVANWMGGTLVTVRLK